MFDARKVARYERLGWEAYYERQWARALWLLIALNRSEFNMPFHVAPRAALHVVRASLAFAPLDNDVPRAQSHLERFYEHARRAAGIPADAGALAELEMSYWVIHRQLAQERKQDPSLNNLEPLIQALVDLHTALFGISRPVARRSAELRAQAAAAVDRITGAYSTNVAADWHAVQHYLEQAYLVVSKERASQAVQS